MKRRIVISILVADDHDVVRAGIKHIIADTVDLEVSGEAVNGKEALEKVCENDYDLVVLDISMPGRDGFDLLKDIKRLRPKLPVLILTMYPEQLYAQRALKAGASGYVTKQTALEELIAAIRKILRGGVYMSASFAEYLALAKTIDTERSPHQTLSDREYQVMLMLASGKRPKEIADILYISPKTISTYRRRILDKMNINSIAALARYAVEYQLSDQ